MGLTFPRTAFMEMFFPDLGWTDVTSLVRQASPVKIARGRANEQGKVAPARLTAVMENESGDMSPGNPMGAYFGLLGRNTPVQWGVAVAWDLFSRIVVDGLGSTTTGESWTLDGTAADFDVGGSTATIAIAAASTTRHAYLTAFSSWGDYEVTVDVTVPYPNGASNSAGLIFRGSTTSDAWRLSVTVDSAGAVTLNIADGAGTLKGSTYTVDTVSAGTYRVRVLVEGGQVWGKAWPVAGPVPYDWQVAYNAESGLNTTGWVGIRARTGTSASNVTFTFDNFTVRVIRVHGELADLRPRWDESHNDKWAELEVAGVLRRMQQGNSPLLSALRRGMLRTTSNPPIYYWPCEDGKDATQFLPAIGSAPGLAAFIGAAKPASNDDVDSSDLLPVFNKAVLQVQVPAYPNPNNELQVRLLVSIPADGAEDGSILCRLFCTGTAGIWDVIYNTSGGGALNVRVLHRDTGAVLAETTNVSMATPMNGHPKQIIVDLTQNGANIEWEVWASVANHDIGAGEASGTNSLGSLNGHTFGLVNVIWLGTAAALAATGFGHLSLHNAISDVFDLSDELGAWAGERALSRFIRLTEEEGLSSSYIGTPSSTAKMGPQRVRTLVDHLGECAAAELGDLYESRAAGILVLRAGATLKAQTPAVTLDYAAGQVSAPLQPGADDQATRNDITVKRTNGSDYHVEQQTGPLNVQNPGSAVGAVGRYDTSVEVNVHSDDQLPDIAYALLAQGTVAEDRYPRIRVDLAASAVAGNGALEAALLGADIDDRVKVTNLSEADIFEPIDQIARGYTETFTDEYGHEIVFNTAPYAPYRVFVLDSSRLDTATTTLAEDLDTTEPAVDINAGDALWTTDAAEYPFPIMINGERMTATNCTGSGPTQTLTVTRSVNGVVRTHTTGDAVVLADPDPLG